MVLKKSLLDDLAQSAGFPVDQVFECFNTFFLNRTKYLVRILCLQMLIILHQSSFSPLKQNTVSPLKQNTVKCFI